MKLAIHHRPGSFSDRWITYCQENHIPYKNVNCYSSEIVEQIKDCNGLMWHWDHGNYRDQNFARQLIYSIEKMGIKVFPNFNTCWHFDDKVGQKYLLEVIQAPLVPCIVFYDEKEALKWTENTIYPKVFKLRGGAGSLNVKLIKNKNEAKRVVKKSFGKGFPLIDKISGFKQRLWILRRDKSIKAIFHLIKGLIRFAYQTKGIGLLPIQKGYVYFQDFIPQNDFDDRIIIIGEKAIAVRRYNRRNDFRASGSGVKGYDRELFSEIALGIAFKISRKLNSQSIAFDFIYEDRVPKIVEISYAFIMGEFYDNCPGYWDRKLDWHKDNVDPQRYIIEDFVNSLREKPFLKVEE